MFDWISNALKAPRQTVVRRPRNVPFVGADVMRGQEEYLQLDGREEAAQRLALCLPESFGAVSNIAKMAAQHDPHVGEQGAPDDKPKPVKNHPLEMVFWRPNKWMSNTFLWWFTYIALPIRGEAFLFVEDGGLPNGDPAELWPIPPWRVKPVPSGDTRSFISHYNYWPESGANPIPMPASNICWIRQPNVTDLHAGMSTVSPAQLPLSLANNQWQFRDRFYGPSRGRPETAIGIKKDVGKTEFEMLKHELMTEFNVLDRATLIHRAGDIDVKLLGMTADDMQLLQFQDHDAKVLQSLFGWNSSLNQATSYAHADVAWEIVAQLGAWPLMKLVAGALTTQVLHPRYSKDLVTYYEDIRPKRRDADRADHQVYGQDLTTNERREARGETPITVGPMAEACATVPTSMLQYYFQQAQQAGRETPATEAQPPARPELPEETKADLVKWERKALRVLSESGVGDAVFESEHIPAPLAVEINGALLLAITPEIVREIFQCSQHASSFS